MELDFSALNKMSGAHPEGAKEKDPSLTGDKETSRQYLRIEKDKQDAEKACKVYEEHQKNILKSEKLRSQINKDISEGADVYNILLKAIECISVMTGDNLFYTGNKEKLERVSPDNRGKSG